MTAVLARVPAATGGGRAWMLVVGAGLVWLALLLVLVPAAAARAPRSRVLSGGLGESTRRRVRDVTDRAAGLADSVLARGEGTSTLDRRLDEAGLDVRPGEFVVGVAAAGVLVTVGVGVIQSWFTGLVAGAAVVACAPVVLGQLAERRRRRFAEQLPDTLRMLAGGLRAGYGLMQAIEVVERESETPTAEEFRRFSVEMRLGRDFSGALRAMAGRVSSRDFDWVVQAFEIHREVGGDLADILDSVNDTIRDRERIRRKVRALSAEGRLSAIVLVALPFLFASFSLVFNPEYLPGLLESTGGILMLAGGAVLMVVGALWLRRLVRLTY